MPKADANSDLEQALGLLEKHLWSGQSLGGELECICCHTFRYTWDGKPTDPPHTDGCEVANFLIKHGRRIDP